MKDDKISWPSAPSGREQTKFEDDNGRLRLADELSNDTRHPILLAKEHCLAIRLIIMDAHEQPGHG